jgi:hypothetical protein
MTGDISPAFIAQQQAMASIETVVVRPQGNANDLIFLMNDRLHGQGKEEPRELVRGYLATLLEAKGISTLDGLSKYKQVGLGQWGMSADIPPESRAKALEVARDFPQMLADAQRGASR